MNNIKKFPMQLGLVFFIALLPVFLGTLLYVFHAHFHFKRINHGVLLSTPIDVKNILPQQGKWRVVYVGDHDVVQPLQGLQHMQQAFGKNAQRIVVLQLDNKHVLRQNKLIQANKIYLVDPLGNLFMYYASTENLKNIYHDLKRLLEVSQIG